MENSEELEKLLVEADILTEILDCALKNGERKPEMVSISYLVELIQNKINKIRMLF